MVLDLTTCKLAILPAGDTQASLFGSHTAPIQCAASEDKIIISAWIYIMEIPNYDAFIGCEIWFRYPQNRNIQTALMRFNRHDIVEASGAPSHVSSKTVTEDNVAEIAKIFNMRHEDFLDASATPATDTGRSYCAIRIQYAKSPPFATRTPSWASNAASNGVIKRLQRSLAKGGTIYALVRESSAPKTSFAKFNALMGKLRAKEPLHTFYYCDLSDKACYSFPPNLAYKGKPKLGLSAQVIFSTWLQYATILGLAAIEDRRQEMERSFPIKSTIQLWSVPGSRDRQYYGALKHDFKSYRLREKDKLEVNFLDNDVFDGCDPEDMPWIAVVTAPFPGTPPGTTPVLVERYFNNRTGRWDERSFRHGTNTRSACAPSLEVEYDIAMDSKVFKQWFLALNTINSQPTLKWVQNALLGKAIIDADKIDMFAGLECDEMANEALWLAMAQFNPQQAAAMEMTRSLPHGIGIIQGPPGTGKTFLIANLVQPLVYSTTRCKSDGPVALLLSTSNASVDDIVTRVQASCDETSRQLSSSRVVTVVRLHPMETERLIFFKSASTSNNIVISDSRAKLMEYSLGNLMFQIAGFIDTAFAQEGQARFGLLREMVKTLDNGKAVDRAHDSKFARLFEELRVAALKQADIIVTTLAGASDPHLYEVIKPRAILIDEASRATDPDVWPVFAWYPRGAKLFVGDSAQLRPVAEFKNPFEQQLALSVMTRLQNLTYPMTFLTEQRRSVRSVCDLYSSIFYGSRLVTQKSVENELKQRGRAFKDAMSVEYQLHTSRSAFLLNVQCGYDRQAKASASYFNVANIHVTMDAVAKLMRQGIAPARIAVLVPYTAQLALYKFAREKAAENDASISELQLETFDSIQGREFDFTIVDFVRTSGLGFLKEGNRVNVAISRARYGLVVVLNASAIHSSQCDFRRTALSEVKDVLLGMKKAVIRFTSLEMHQLTLIDGLDDMASGTA